jgi:ubiquinone/menaquinone biosynthesis C-methylase UbiE
MASAYYRLVTRLLPEVEYHQNKYAKKLDTFLGAGHRWLDLGAGASLHGGWGGRSQADLAGRASLLVGCDMEAYSLRENPYLTAGTVADGGTLPFSDSTFDLVTANMVLEHLSDPLVVFKEIARVLRPGGRFVFVTPNRGHPAVRLLSLTLSRAARRRVAAILENRELKEVFPTFYRANSPQAILAAAVQANLRVVDLEAFCSFPMIKFALPMTWLECWWIRVTLRPSLERFRSNIVGCLERPHGALPPCDEVGGPGA